MAAEGRSATASTAAQPDNRRRSIFELSGDFFDNCRVISPGVRYSPVTQFRPPRNEQTLISTSRRERNDEISITRLTCNTCKEEFDSLVDQRSHFKSDLHRFNVKLTLAGKNTINEEDFDEFYSGSFPKDFDVSSISGSEDEDEKVFSHMGNISNEALVHDMRRKIFIRLSSGEMVSMWKCLLMKECETVSYENDGFDVIEKLKISINEPRDGKYLRVVLLAHGGHFAGCVFDGNNVVVSKTFHRYVVRAKAGKKQSSKDASGRSIHSAGASLRRYNELAMKKDIQELLLSWKPYFDTSICVYIHAPSSNRELLFNNNKPLFYNPKSDTRNIPFIVRRPTLKEAKRIYTLLTQVSFEVNQDEVPNIANLELNGNSGNESNPVINIIDDEVPNIANLELNGNSGNESNPVINIIEDETEIVKETPVCVSTTPLHEAAKCGDTEKVLELLERGLDPSVKDGRGKTAYMVANEKEVRNIFRRFMAENMEKWDWHAANVPSALTKEMEESQAAKQSHGATVSKIRGKQSKIRAEQSKAEKDAKRKAKAKELKKLRKEREKKAKAQASESNNVATNSETKVPTSLVRPSHSRLSKEEELKRKLEEEREKRAAAAERRFALNSGGAHTSESSRSSQSPTKSGVGNDVFCSCCKASLEGKVPFHRYNYKYCSTTCMRVHKEFLEEG